MIFTAILAFLKAIPVLKSLFDEFVVFYANSEISEMKTQDREAIRKAIEGHDQRWIEKALGVEGAKPVDMAGSVIRDVIPGVVSDKKTS